MKKKNLKTVNIAAAIIFAAAFFLNLQANFDGGLAGFLGQPLIAQGTGSGGTGTGSGSGSGSGSGCPTDKYYYPDMMLKTKSCSWSIQVGWDPPKFETGSGSKINCYDHSGTCCDPDRITLCKKVD